jgi:prepilin-type N-terminal cleavage/methylation domain-containing protein
MKNNVRSSRLAFSLIELSIVVLIIGILIAGVTQGSRLVRQAKLKTAQSLTQNSSVASISGLQLWMETTMDKSFDRQGGTIDDQTLISSWNDINPQLTSKIATQATDDNQPTYLANGINGLPSLRFYGLPTVAGFASFDYLDLGNIKLSPSNSISIFVVYRLNNTGNNYFIGHLSGWGQWRMSDASFQSSKGSYSGLAVSTNVTYIQSLVASDLQVTIYRNSQLIGSSVLTSGVYLESTNVWIGGTENGGYYSVDGMVGEIIVFDRKLKDSERVDVEQYLAKKWGVVF